MSSVAYETVELEDSISENGSESQRPKLFVVGRRRHRFEDEIARRVAKVLDLELAQGSMPT
ncbi:MAG: hypothetical protein ACLPND_01530 [Candidatus Korobacteraceae bacterium]